MSGRRGPMPPGMGGLPPGLNPEMLKQLAGRMPPGMMPAMGGMPGMPGAAPQTPSKERYNPLPEGKGAMQVLKAHSGCQMPREAAQLNAMLQKSQEMPVAPGREDELYAAMSEAITLVFRSEHECEKNVSTRTAGLFNEEPELKDLSDKVDTLFKECEELEKTLKAKADEYNRLSQERWEKAVKLFGLNIQERFYRIDGEKRNIQQIDLRCDNCQSLKMLRNARQKLAGILIGIEAVNRGENVTIEPPKEEKVDGAEAAGHSDAPGPDADAADKAQGENAAQS